MKVYTAEEWLPSHSGLGESPLYRASDDTFSFVDIKNRLVHTVHIVQLDEPVTRLDIVEGRTDVLAAQTKLGFALLDPNKGTLDRIADVHHEEDAAIDSKSNLGRLWCLRDGRADDASAGDRAAVLNGPAWSPDNKTVYVCDTVQGKIYQYDYDLESGDATNKQLFAHLEGGGMPDGLAVDLEGHAWVAANSQGKIVRLSPEGTVTGACIIPGAKLCSCPAFGGSDMKTIFVTSIMGEGSTGNVYRVRVDVADYPLAIWWHITNALTSVADVHRFSRVSKGMSELLAYRRAVMEAEHYLEFFGRCSQWKTTLHPIGSCVENALRRRQPVEVIESMIRGCFSVSGFYLNGTEPMTDNIPALFVAAELNRVDVIKVLLAQGIHHDLRYPVRSGCLEIGHYDCLGPDMTCRNALCIAREYKSRDAEAFLLKEGVEDRCDDDHCLQWHWY
ncbi:hypothetical protein F4818DRAFT_441096 [Hypoxylon cercidicola]|nr:hypothetical protein F4818DRAFT_441096 [Hypoxylon cercidicola]